MKIFFSAIEMSKLAVHKFDKFNNIKTYWFSINIINLSSRSVSEVGVVPRPCVFSVHGL